MRTVFEPEGDLRGVDVLAAFVALWRAAGSGSLQFSRSGATAGFEIAGGELLASSSSDPRFDTAAILVRAGKLDTRTLERLAAPEGADRALLALQAGVLTRREYRWGEKIRAVEILSDLLTWLEGEYFFLPRRGTRAGNDRAPPADSAADPRAVPEVARPQPRPETPRRGGRAAGPRVEFRRRIRDLRPDGRRRVGRPSDRRDLERRRDRERGPRRAFAVEKLLAALVTLGLVSPGVRRSGASARAARGASDAAATRTRGGGAEDVAPREDQAVDAEVDERVTDDEVEATGAERMTEEPAAPRRPSTRPPGHGTRKTGTPRKRNRARARASSATSSRTGGGGRGGARGRASLRPGFGRARSGVCEPGRRAGTSRPGGIEPGGRRSGGLRSAARHGPNGDLERPPQRSGSLLIWVLAVFSLAGVVAILWLRGRGPAAPAAAVAAPTATATEMPTTSRGTGCRSDTGALDSRAGRGGLPPRPRGGAAADAPDGRAAFRRGAGGGGTYEFRGSTGRTARRAMPAAFRPTRRRAMRCSSSSPVKSARSWTPSSTTGPRAHVGPRDLVPGPDVLPGALGPIRHAGSGPARDVGRPALLRDLEKPPRRHRRALTPQDSATLIHPARESSDAMSTPAHHPPVSAGLCRRPPAPGPAADLSRRA